ncbi:MAG: hypothetical protein K9H64_22245 [Bacteroidales bacterium]|nr:hypothetical protein [Bacteroidales bacterium]MCF8458771.1 hypothetical protein [Bacteroidales bacterium]
MKKFIAVFLLLIISITSYAQLKEQENELYQRKVQSFTKMKKTGGILAGIGGGLTMLSIVAISNAEWEKTVDIYGNTNYNTTDGSGVLGIVGLVVGIPMGVTGIVLNTIGKKKVKYYSEKMKNIDVGMYQWGQQKGLTLTIKF